MTDARTSLTSAMALSFMATVAGSEPEATVSRRPTHSTDGAGRTVFSACTGSPREFIVRLTRQAICWATADDVFVQTRMSSQNASRSTCGVVNAWATAAVMLFMYAELWELPMEHAVET